MSSIILILVHADLLALHGQGDEIEWETFAANTSALVESSSPLRVIPSSLFLPAHGEGIICSGEGASCNICLHCVETSPKDNC